MTSKINPTNVNGSFPLIGVSNDSQGFRNNFTNTSTNLRYAKEEIEDLQSRGVFIRDVIGDVVNNNMLGSTISNAYVAAVSDLVKEHNSVSGAVVINFNDGSYHTLVANGPIALDTQWGNLNNQTLSYGVMRIEINITDISHTVSFPIEVSIGAAAIVGYNTSNGMLTPPNIGKYVFELSTIDGGSTITIRQDTSSVTTVTSITTLISNVSTLTADLAALTSNVAISNMFTSLVDTNINANLLAHGDHITYDSTTAKWVNSHAHEVFDVTIIDNGSGSQEVYCIDGVPIKTHLGVISNRVKFTVGNRYRFMVDDISNTLIPLSFSSAPDTVVDVTNPNNTVIPWTTDVYRYLTPGVAGAFVEIEITEATPSPLYLFGEQIPPVLDTSKLGAEYPNYITSNCCHFNIELPIVAANVATIDASHAVTSFAVANTMTAVLGDAGRPGNKKLFVIDSLVATKTLTVTVTNAGWKVGAGTITFSTLGATCSLQFIKGKWFCTGNNGVVFA